MKYLPGRVLLRFGFFRHTKTLVSESSCSLRSTGVQMSKCHRRPFFRKKSFAKKFSKIQGQINPLSNLNLACEALFFVDFFTYSYSVFGLSSLIYSALSQMKWYTASQNPKSNSIITDKIFLMDSVNSNCIYFQVNFQQWSFLNQNMYFQNVFEIDCVNGSNLLARTLWQKLICLLFHLFKLRAHCFSQFFSPLFLFFKGATCFSQTCEAWSTV